MDFWAIYCDKNSQIVKDSILFYTTFALSNYYEQ